MSQTLPTISEAAFQRQVLAYARLHRWLSAHFRPALTKSGKWITAVQGDGAGFPDLVLVKDRVIFVELKAERGQLTDAQNLWFVWLKCAGAEVYLWRPSDWPEIERILGGET